MHGPCSEDDVTAAPRAPAPGNKAAERSPLLREVAPDVSANSRQAEPRSMATFHLETGSAQGSPEERLPPQGQPVCHGDLPSPPRGPAFHRIGGVRTSHGANPISTNTTAPDGFDGSHNMIDIRAPALRSCLHVLSLHAPFGYHASRAAHRQPAFCSGLETVQETSAQHRLNPVPTTRRTPCKNLRTSSADGAISGLHQHAANGSDLTWR